MEPVTDWSSTNALQHLGQVPAALSSDGKPTYRWMTPVETGEDWMNRKTAAWEVIYPSRQDAYDWIVTRERTVGACTSSVSAPNDSGSWHGAGYQEALDMLVGGDHNTARVRKLEDLALTIEMESPPLDFRPRTMYSEEGGSLHIGRHLAGIEEEWQSIQRAGVGASTGHGHAVRIVVNNGVSGAMSASQMAEAGAAVAATVIALERAGLSTELVVTYGVSLGNKPNDYASQAIMVKNAGEPLDMAVASFCLGNPAMLRRIGFALAEREAPRLVHAYGWGYGHCREYPKRLAALHPGTVVLDMTQYRRNEPSAFLQRMIEHLSERGEDAA